MHSKFENINTAKIHLELKLYKLVLKCRKVMDFCAYLKY